MDEGKFNMSMRKFLKQVGVTSQRAIEEHVRERGMQRGRLDVRMVLTMADGASEHVVEGAIELE